MNTVVPISRDDQRLEAASCWVLKIYEGALSASDKAALGAWLDEDLRHRDVLLEVAAVWDKTDALARLADFFPHDPTPGQAPPVPCHWPWTQSIAVATGLVLLAVAAVLLLPRLPGVGSDRPLPTQSAAYETAIGERKTVLLPDGSEVVLNTNSQLSLTFTPSARVLHLARGEILVRVAKDESRPLSVVAGDRIVQAIGTEFTVEITENQQVEVMVTEGKVVVGIQPLSVASPGATDAASDAAAGAVVLPPLLAQLEDNTVSAGEAVILGAPDTVKKAVTADDIEVKLSWTEGRLIFRSEPLEKALAEVERYTTVEFVLLDEDLKTRTVSGRFRAGDVDALLLSLRLNFNITHELDSENRVLLSSQ
jgi:transmembrane sensor